MAKKIYFVIRKSWKDRDSQVGGAFVNQQRAIDACPPGYTVFQNNGRVEYTNYVSSLKETEDKDYEAIWNSLKDTIKTEIETTIDDINIYRNLSLFEFILNLRKYNNAIDDLSKFNNILRGMRFLEVSHLKNEEDK